jgi:hypothetical protein
LFHAAEIKTAKGMAGEKISRVMATEMRQSSRNSATVL